MPRKPKIPVPTRTFTAAALDAELGRRRNNKHREKKVTARSFVLPKLSKATVAAIKDGEIVTVNFASGRVETVGLKAAA